MSAPGSGPSFRTDLIPFSERPGGVQVIRFLAKALFRTPSATRRFGGVVLNLEEPYSIIPYAVQAAQPIDVTPVPAAWRTPPTWRGVPCDLATTTVSVWNQRANALQDFRLFALLPSGNPSGPAVRHVQLGQDFLRHHRMRIRIDFDAIDYIHLTHAPGGAASLSTPCGTLEAD